MIDRLFLCKAVMDKAPVDTCRAISHEIHAHIKPCL